MKTMLRKLQKVMENNNGAMEIWFKDMEIVRLSWFCFVLDCVRGLYSQNTCTKDHKVTDGVHPQIDVKEWFFIEELKGILDHYFECRCDWFTEKMRCIFTHWCHVVIFQSLNLYLKVLWWAGYHDLSVLIFIWIWDVSMTAKWFFILTKLGSDPPNGT